MSFNKEGNFPLFFIIHLRNIFEIEFPPVKAAWRGRLTSVSRVEIGGGGAGDREGALHTPKRRGTVGRHTGPRAPSQDTHLCLPENLPECTSAPCARLLGLPVASSPSVVLSSPWPRGRRNQKCGSVGIEGGQQGLRSSQNSSCGTVTQPRPRAAGGRRKGDKITCREGRLWQEN